MKWFLFCLLPMIPAAVRASSGNEAASDSSDFTIYIDFARPPSASAVRLMKGELHSIMAPLGMKFDWRQLSTADGHSAVLELLVVRFRGACQVDILPPRSNPGPLGWTHVSNGKILPFTDVDCDRIRELLALHLAMAPRQERPGLLGRAMARVLAHELYHFLTNSTQHTSCGIAKRSYNAGDLSASALVFDPEGLEILREHAPHLSGELTHGSP
ncbi:MAG TPA: hypothetical protein VMI94_03485 [Bryobacteraceae bacterium]|nr:hypothetical protein [Bryobacteraceae bacterium]